MHEDALSSCRLVQFPGGLQGLPRPGMTTVFRGLDRLLGVRYLRQVPDVQIYFSVLLAFIRAGKQVSRSLLHVLHALDKSLCRRSRGSPAWTWRLGKYTRYGGTDELNWYPRS